VFLNAPQDLAEGKRIILLWCDRSLTALMRSDASLYLIYAYAEHDLAVNAMYIQPVSMLQSHSLPLSLL
jgi:hypothetical protein